MFFSSHVLPWRGGFNQGLIKGKQQKERRPKELTIMWSGQLTLKFKLGKARETKRLTNSEKVVE